MKRVQAFFLAVLMVITTVLGVNVGNVIEVKAEGETTVIIHYQRPDGDYEQNKPPLIKSKILLCVALVLAGAFALGTGVGLAAAI